RNREKCFKVRDDIMRTTGNKEVHCRQCDLSDFDSVVSFVSQHSKGKFELDRIDGVVHNAAVMDSERKVNKDGIESTLATNHLGPFLLTELLLEKLKAQSDPVRLVFVNTNIIKLSTNFNFANFNEELQPKEPISDEEKARPKEWDGYEVYKRSKLGEAMFAKDLAEKVKNSNISVTMADPVFAHTNLWPHALPHFLFRWIMHSFLWSFSFIGGSTKRAAQPVLYAVADPEMEGKNGVFINRDGLAEQEWGENVEDEEARRKLWAGSEELTRLPDRLSDLRRSIEILEIEAKKNVEVTKNLVSDKQVPSHEEIEKKKKKKSDEITKAVETKPVPKSTFIYDLP
ncbi:hypothetical protein PMAYCL1PPCAC_27387, partial [Pristionchus mayeri]